MSHQLAEKVRSQVLVFALSQNFNSHWTRKSWNLNIPFCKRRSKLLNSIPSPAVKLIYRQSPVKSPDIKTLQQYFKISKALFCQDPSKYTHSNFLSKVYEIDPFFYVFMSHKYHPCFSFIKINQTKSHVPMKIF